MLAGRGVWHGAPPVSIARASRADGDRSAALAS